jgi:tellurite resistance protein TerA
MAIDYTKRPAKSGPSPVAPVDSGVNYNKGAARPSAAPASGGVSLSKVTLTKSAPSVSLIKGGGGQLRVNLQWTARPDSIGKGFFKAMKPAIDLDLACLWEFSNGTKGVVQALGNAFQAPAEGPAIVRLDGDDRSGSNAGGENLFVDLNQVDRIRRILVFAFIYEGVPNWAGADGVVTLYPGQGPDIEVRLDDAGSNARFCVIAQLVNQGGQLVVNREVRYIQGSQRTVDEAYGWGLRWQAGSK